MSTRFTQLGTPMIESQSLKLVFMTAGIHDQITEHIASKLKQDGYSKASPSILNFLSALDCGINVGSDIARRLKVSRQMVAKTVKELCHAGYLEQVEGPGKQKHILFTAEGEQLMSKARQLLAQLDEVLYQKLGKNSLDEALNTLEIIHGLISEEYGEP